MSQLRKHQKKGVELANKYGKVLLAYDMGTGKTRTAIFSVKEQGGLIVTKSRIMTDWGHELEKVGEPNFQIIKTAKDEITGAKWTIVSYDILKTFNAEEWKGTNLIIDESHSIKANPKRSKKTGKPNRTGAVHSIAEVSEKVILLTGTPITNKPIDLYNQLVAIDHPLTKIGITAFSKRYCGGHLRRLGRYANGRPRMIWWDKGATNIEELGAMLGEVVQFVKLNEVLELPEIVKSNIHIELNKQERKEYSEIWNEYIQWLTENSETAIADWEKKIKKYKVKGIAEEVAGIILTEKEIDKRTQSQAIIKSTKTRQYTSKVKAKYFIDDLQENIKGQAIIFCEFVETKNYLLKELGKEALPLEKVEDFKQGKAKYLVANIVAGGTGINLQNAQTVIFIDENWTPAINQQAIARIHRMGQEKKTSAIFLRASGTIDDLVEMSNIEKQETIDKVEKYGK